MSSYCLHKTVDSLIFVSPLFMSFVRFLLLMKIQDKDKDKDKDKDLFIGQQEFVVGYSKAPEQLQSSARPICHSHARSMTRTGREPATILIAA